MNAQTFSIKIEKQMKYIFYKMIKVDSRILPTTLLIAHHFVATNK